MKTKYLIFSTEVGARNNKNNVAIRLKVIKSLVLLAFVMLTGNKSYGQCTPVGTYVVTNHYANCSIKVLIEVQDCSGTFYSATPVVISPSSATNVTIPGGGCYAVAVTLNEVNNTTITSTNNIWNYTGTCLSGVLGSNDSTNDIDCEHFTLGGTSSSCDITP